jgi:hypothetical protein
MRYLTLIYVDEQAVAAMSAEERAKNTDAWYAYTTELAKSGLMLAGDALHPTNSATTVRIQNGKTVISDGPYAETKEQLGGYYLVEAENLDQVLEWAARMPNVVHGGSVEVRPIWEMAPKPSA